MRDRYSWWTGLDWSLWATTRNKPEDALTCSASSDDISALSLLLLRSETLTLTPPIFTGRDRWRNTEVVWWIRPGARVYRSATHRWDFGKVRLWTYPVSGTEQEWLELEHRPHDLKEEELKRCTEAAGAALIWQVAHLCVVVCARALSLSGISLLLIVLRSDECCICNFHAYVLCDSLCNLRAAYELQGEQCN